MYFKRTLNLDTFGGIEVGFDITTAPNRVFVHSEKLREGWTKASWYENSSA
jgi:hypothetical protein